MNFLHRLSIALLALSFHQISFSMESTYVDLEPYTELKFRDSILTVRPPFDKLDIEDPMTRAISQFARSLLSQGKGPFYYPLLVITQSNELHKEPILAFHPEYKQFEVSNKNQYALLHLLPNGIRPSTETIKAIVQLTEVAHQKSYSDFTVLITQDLQRPGQISPPPFRLAPISPPVGIPQILPTPQVQSLPPSDDSGWRRVPVARTPQQILTAYKKSTKPTILSYPLSNQTKLVRYPAPPPLIPHMNSKPEQQIDVPDAKPL